jgi:hypothetical protein
MLRDSARHVLATGKAPVIHHVVSLVLVRSKSEGGITPDTAQSLVRAPERARVLSQSLKE